MILNKLREQSFWLLDKFKGEKIRRHYNEIAFINENFDTKSAQEQRMQYLSNILNHAVETTPFYKEYAHFKELNDFPVVRKIVIQDNFENFKSKSYLDEPKFKVATSGSTGIPFFLFQDSNKKMRNTADTLYFLNNANFRIGERLYDLEVWRGINMNSPIKSWMQNLKYVDITRFSEVQVKAFLVTLKENKEPQHLIGFVSAFESICKYLDKIESKPLEINVKSVIAISEYLTEYAKSSMQKYFQIPIVSRYSNEELGILAQQRPVMDRTEFKINWASYHIEILNMNNDVPVQPGELGRIVVTDFFNYCMPIIRYDTGDIARFSENNIDGIGAPYFEKLEGRKMDMVYDTRGDLISSFIVYTKFHRYYGLLKQYQFIQTHKKEYLVKLNIQDSFNFEEELIEDIKVDFGKDAIVSIEYVDEIPALSSGKRKKVVNLYSQY
jgi:phenylacetate-CoA ligase